MSGFVKVPCKHCPFRKDVTPFLHPERAEELTSVALNPYSSFPCHKTVDYSDGDGEGTITNESLECAGMLSLRAHEGVRTPKGFEPSELVYEDSWDMQDAYQEQWEKGHGNN